MNAPKNDEPDDAARRAAHADDEQTPRIPESIDAKIAHFENEVQKDPALYPVFAVLGRLYLDRARESRDPGDVARSADALSKSAAIQETIECVKTRAALENFRHRFDHALAWAGRAREISPEDSQSTAMIVEALEGLGRIDEADEIVPAAVESSENFFLLAARARIATARGDPVMGSRLYLSASTVAEKQRATSLAAWAKIRAAAAFIDSGDPASALPILESVPTSERGTIDWTVHRSEVDAGMKREREALTRLEGILERIDDPIVRAAAAGLSRSLGDTERAEAHFRAAEARLMKAVEAGEVYTLGSLARLYIDCGKSDPRIVDWAERNFESNRTEEARETLERAKANR